MLYKAQQIPNQIPLWGNSSVSCPRNSRNSRVLKKLSWHIFTEFFKSVPPRFPMALNLHHNHRMLKKIHIGHDLYA